MNFVKKLKSQKNDMKTLSGVTESSLEYAAMSGESIAGAHHLALAAFDMDDARAADALTSLGSSVEDFVSALRNLDANTLADLGIEDVDISHVPVERSRLGKTDATYEAALKATHQFHTNDKDRPQLRSSHLLAGVASVEFGTSARVFADLGLDRQAVIDRCIELG